jgi:hypothetical protein
LLPGTMLELAARYAVLDGGSEPDHDALVRSEEFAGAINYYFARHQLKLQANYARFVNNGDYSGALGRMNVQLQAAF